jgi:hypothetical protein
LEELDLRGTPIEPQNAEQFLNTLQLNYTLRKLEVTPKGLKENKVVEIYRQITVKLKENGEISPNDLRYRFSSGISGKTRNCDVKFSFVTMGGQYEWKL